MVEPVTVPHDRPANPAGRTVAEAAGGGRRDRRPGVAAGGDRVRTAAVVRTELDGKTLCRSAIGWVSLALNDRRERAELVTGLPERELQNDLIRFGRLPVPG